MLRHGAGRLGSPGARGIARERAEYLPPGSVGALAF